MINDGVFNPIEQIYPYGRYIMGSPDTQYFKQRHLNRHNFYCSMCGRNRILKKCSRCKNVSYCSRECKKKIGRLIKRYVIYNIL